MRRLKSMLWLLGCFAVLSIGLGFMTREPAWGQKEAAVSAKRKALLEERRDVLKQRVEAVQQAFQSAQRPYQDVIAARNDLFDAELALASNKAGRIEILQQKLANAKTDEALMRDLVASAKGTTADVLMATARRLKVEVELLDAHE